MVVIYTIANNKMIKETVNEYRFRDVLLADQYANWSFGACCALYDYLCALSDDMGEDIELDPVAIRCNWSEYPNAREAYLEHQPYVEDAKDLLALASIDDEQEKEQVAREWLEERTTVLDVENIDTSASEYRIIKSILVMQF